VGCGDTGPTQALEQADGYVSAYKIQFDKVSKLGDTTGTDFADSKPTCADDLGNLALAAKAVAAALPKAPGCMPARTSWSRQRLTSVRPKAEDGLSPGSGGLGINQPDGAPGRSGARYQTVKLELALALWPLNWQLTVCVPVPLPVLVVVR
jgi:hypothetical protein